LKYYDFVKISREKLDSSLTHSAISWRHVKTAFSATVQAYQAGANNLTIGQARALEEDLQKKGQNLQLYEQSLQQQIMTSRVALHRSFIRNYRLPEDI